MELNECPHDGSIIEAEMVSGGSLLLICPACGAEWESHGAWLRDVRAPVVDLTAEEAFAPKR
jgi:hypothetical protein